MPDFETLDTLLVPVFRELDNEALRQQNRYRWMYIVLIFGGTLATILGVVQLAFSTLSWPGFVGAIVAAILAVTTTISRTFKHHEHYLNARLATERLRGEYFLFLGHCPPYEKDQDRLQRLRQKARIGGCLGEPTVLLTMTLAPPMNRGRRNRAAKPVTCLAIR